MRATPFEPRTSIRCSFWCPTANLRKLRCRLACPKSHQAETTGLAHRLLFNGVNHDYTGAQSACEWRTLTGTGRTNVGLLNWEALTAGPMIISLRAKVETTAASKLCLLFNTVYVNPLWELAVDITPDGTPPEARVGHHSARWSDVWVEEHPDYPG